MDVSGLATWLSYPPAAGAAVVAAAFVAGCLVGSFLNVVVHRAPRGETVVFGRSRCPACGATIRPRDNVPIVGWLLLKGRCRDCGAAISARYPLVEAACGGLLAVLAAVEIAAAPAGDPLTPAVAWCGRAALALTLVSWLMLAGRGHAVSFATAAVACGLFGVVIGWQAALVTAGAALAARRACRRPREPDRPTV